ncbi:hypothetical protein [Mucilaginibacter aquatilis]|uniref:DUF481 domain-containing protein n=1 Tax=Mucilaginibacter aquatilis TaxID=1517760 RepID=A0A6I4IBZ6_9SPHI|nr:hypothetical protein [Mucilaginibacter aquatilis]MVN92632.1 hypothetical protein [Mucilaginibacter aquatilis]
MTKYIWLTLAGMLTALFQASAQELYVNSEPASNMAAKSLGIRLENQGYFKPDYRNRTTLEAMLGINKYIMVHGTAYMSDFYQDKQRFEGVSAYAKYRFYSADSVQRHFRMAAFAKASSIRNVQYNQEISLEGDNTGLQGGLVATQLVHKLAVSGSLSYLRAFENRGGYEPVNRNSIAYTLSAGYLLFPKKYTNYEQTNINLYAELLGKSNPGKAQYYVDIAPAIQFIFNSVLRVDLSYRTPLTNRMLRNTQNMYLVRVEYNLFNIFN